MTQSTYAIIGVCGDKSLVLGANLVIKDEALLLRYARQYQHYRPAFAVRVKRWKHTLTLDNQINSHVEYYPDVTWKGLT